MRSRGAGRGIGGVLGEGVHRLVPAPAPKFDADSQKRQGGPASAPVMSRGVFVGGAPGNPRHPSVSPGNDAVDCTPTRGVAHPDENAKLLKLLGCNGFSRGVSDQFRNDHRTPHRREPGLTTPVNNHATQTGVAVHLNNLWLG